MYEFVKIIIVKYTTACGSVVAEWETLGFRAVLLTTLGSNPLRSIFFPNFPADCEFEIRLFEFYFYANKKPRNDVLSILNYKLFFIYLFLLILNFNLNLDLFIHFAYLPNFVFMYVPIILFCRFWEKLNKNDQKNLSGLIDQLIRQGIKVFKYVNFKYVRKWKINQLLANWFN